MTATHSHGRRCDTDEPRIRTSWHTPDRITLDRRPASVARCGRGLARAHSRRATAERRERRPGRRDSPRRRRRRRLAAVRPASRNRVPTRSGPRQAMGARAATSRSDIELRDPAARGRRPYAPNSKKELMSPAGFEPATSRLGIDKPRPSARQAGECVARRGALPAELRTHEHGSLRRTAGVTRTRDPLGRSQVL